jgi:hypothetical protein
LCCAALAVSARAFAQAQARHAAVLPAGAGPGVSHRLAAHAQRAMQDFLLDRGYALVEARALNRLPASLRDCKDKRCMPAVHRALAADEVIALELRRGGSASSLCAQWNDAGFVAYTSEIALAANTSDAAEDAGQEAIRALLEKARRGPGPWLSIAGTPDGAAVEIDGKVAGSVPFLGRVEPGRARVVVRKEGYAPFEHDVQVGEAADDYQRLRVALTPKHAVQVAALRPLTREQLAGKSSEPKSIVSRAAPDARVQDYGDEGEASAPAFHPADVAIGAAMMLGGAALAIGPAQTWARDGKCWDPPDCTQHVDFDRSQQLQLVGAGVLAVTGLLWTFVVKPIGHATAPDVHAARATEGE